jgi:hypothetical protein
VDRVFNGMFEASAKLQSGEAVRRGFAAIKAAAKRRKKREAEELLAKVRCFDDFLELWLILV